MANFRQIHVNIWKDNWFIDLEPDEKLLFVYLFSNESTSLAGIYKIPIRVMSFETGIIVPRVNQILEKFSKENKVHYEDGVVWVVNMRRFHATKSDRVLTRIRQDIDSIPECELKIAYLEHNIPYRYPIDTSQQLKGIGKEKENEMKDEQQIKEIVDRFRSVYEQNVGVVVPIVLDELHKIAMDYPEAWFVDAVKIAVHRNARNLKYIEGILRNWKAHGRGGKGEKKETDWAEQARKYGTD